MPIKLVYIASSEAEINGEPNDVVRNESLARERGNPYIEKDGNYILCGFPKKAEAYEKLFSALGQYPPQNPESEDKSIRNRIFEALKFYWNKLMEKYPEFEKRFSNRSNRYVILIHKGGEIPGGYGNYTQGLIDACYSCDKDGSFKNIVFSMVSQNDSFPKKYWNRDHKLVFCEDDELPKEIKVIMDKLKIPNDYFFSGDAVRDRPGQPIRETPDGDGVMLRTVVRNSDQTESKDPDDPVQDNDEGKTNQTNNTDNKEKKK